MSVKISAFEIENVKRVKAVAYEPTENGLTVLGGKNGQGKTSVLDAIALGSAAVIVSLRLLRTVRVRQFRHTSKSSSQTVLLWSVAVRTAVLK